MRLLPLLAISLALSGCQGEKSKQSANSEAQGQSGATQPGTSTAPAATPAAPDSAIAQLLDGAVNPRQQGIYPPRDDCGPVPGARAFREKLARAVLTKDVEAIVALSDGHVKLGFGGVDGRENLRKRLQDPAYLAEWKAVLGLGCAIDPGGQLVLPWHFAQELGVDDPYSAMLVTASEQPLLEQASPQGARLGTLSWDTVSLVDGLKPDAAYQQVRTRNGKTGFVETRALRSLLDYRLLATSRGSTWRVTAMVAGD